MVGERGSLARIFQPKELDAGAPRTPRPTSGTATAPRPPSLPRAAVRTGWLSSLVAETVGTMLPGFGSELRRLDLRILAPLVVGETYEARLTLASLETEAEASSVASFHCRIFDPNGATVAEGEAEAPVTDRPTPRGSKRGARRDGGPGAGLRALVERAREERLRAQRAPLRTAVVHAVDAPAIEGAIDAARAGLIAPVFVGPKERILRAARETGLDLDPYRIVPTEHSHAAAERAVALARSGDVEALMKGSLHTDELMHAVVDSEHGLRTSRRVSHVFVVDAPHWPRLLLLTDAAINVRPDLAAKRDIVQNAIDLARVLGVSRPRVALLSSLETVTPTIPSTLDAAALCKMADRGQIEGGLLDGPLAFDNAVSSRAARTKGIASSVSGRPDVLVVPDLDAGNMLAKGLEYLGGARLAGIVLGTRVPVILTSRADLAEARMASCAVALLQALASDRAAKARTAPKGS
jgi:phosphotransacetylase